MTLGSVELVLLAAGESRRFGADKRWATLASDEEPLWLRSLNCFTPLGIAGVLVIRSAEAADFKPKLPGNFRLLENQLASQGMESSRAAGLAVVEADYAMIALADMPFIRPETVQTLLSAARRLDNHSSIIQPAYKGQPGHPKLFRRALFDALKQCRLPIDTKRLLDRYSDSTFTIDVSDAGILRDVDRRSDLTPD